MFNTSKNKVSRPSVGAMQICVSLMLDSCLIDKLSIEIYENQIFSSDFTSIYVYLFRLSFFTTLNIYKDYFKGRHS